MANIFKAKTLVSRTGIFSHEVIAPNLVYNTGNQIISGNKTFKENILVEGTGIFNSVDLSNISEFQFSGTNIDLIDSNIYVSGAGWIYISGNPVVTGHASLSLLELNNIVYTTGTQTIIGVKDFNNLINVSGIKFDILTTDQVPAHQEGLLYYSDDDKTLNLDTDVTDLSLPIGQENWVRAKNLTNSTLSVGTVVYISGAQGNTPLVRKSIATSDGESARTLGVAAHSITNNSKGYFTTFGLVEGIDTSAYSVGQTLYLSWETSGAFTGVKPQAPNHMVRIGNVIDQGNNGSIFVTIQNGFEIDELHDVRITNPKNKDGIIYNSASGLWLNTAAALADEVVYNTGNQIISGNKIFTQNINVSGTGVFNALDINNIDNLSLSGVDITITNGNVSLTNLPTVNGTGVVLSGELTASGNLLQGQINTLTTNLITTGSNLNNKINSLSGSAVLLYGNQTISENKTFVNSGIFSLSGAAPLTLPNNPLSIVGSGNHYVQINIQNRSSGTDASADLVITANNGSDNTNYINLGINNSGYNNPAFSIGSGLDGYLFNNGGELSIGTQTPNKNINFHIGGTTQNKRILTLDSNGLKIPNVHPLTNSVTIEIAEIQKSAGEANPINITTSSPHGAKVGDTVVVAGLKTAGCNNSALNGTYTIAEVITAFLFRYYIPGNNTTALANLYAVGCGFPPATVTISVSEISISNFPFSGYKNLLINAPPMIDSNKINIRYPKTPASSTDVGVKGDIAWDSNYLYVCVNFNTWKRFSGFSW